MSEKKKGPSIKTLLIIVVPIVVLAVVYITYFGEDPAGDGTVEVSNFEGAPIPEGDSIKRNSGSKADLYSQSEQSINAQKEKQVKSQNIDEIIASSSSSPAAPDPREREYADAWGVSPDKPADPVTPKPVSKTRKTTNASSAAAPAPVAPSPTPVQNRRGGFYGSSGSSTTSPAEQKDFLGAVVHGDYVVKSGQTIKIRTTEDGSLGGIAIPKNTILSGVVGINNERVIVHINSVKIGSVITPIAVTVYDMDGVEGIYIPGGVNQDIAKGTVQNGVSISTRVPIVGGTISTGSQQKVQDPSVNISTGYKIMLKKVSL